MKKYTIDDLIIDDPGSGSEKSGQKPRGKFTTIIALIAIIVVAGVFLSKMKMGSFTDSNIAEETKIEDGNIKELLEPKQEKSVNAEQEAQKAADDLSIAITELDSLAPPKTEPIKDEIVTAKTEELLDQKQEELVPAAQETQKVADELSIAGTETKSTEPTATEQNKDETVTTNVEDLIEQRVEALVPAAQETQKVADEPSVATVESQSSPEPTATEPKIDEIAAAGAEKLPETQQETNESEKQEPQKISDILPTVSTSETLAEKSIPKSEESIASEESKVESSISSTREPETDTLKNSTPEVIDSQEKAKAEEKKTVQPKQETKSTVSKTPETKTEKSASEKEKEKITAKKKKVKSEPKPKPKKDGFFNQLSSKNKYYILVGSNPSSRFLSKIKNAKLRYVIRISNGKRSVFVGPYSSSSNARRSIGKVQKVTGIKGVVVKAK